MPANADKQSKGKSRSAGDDRVADIDSYLVMIAASLERYSPDQRTVFVAALAERWLPIYEAASRAGLAANPAPLREALDAAWNHAQGKRLPAPDLERLQQRLDAAAPSAPGKVRAAWDLVRQALECCGPAASVGTALQAARAACEAVVEPVPAQQLPTGPDSNKQVWRQPAVMAEVARQHDVLVKASHPIVNEFMVDYFKRDARAGTVQLGGGNLMLAMNLAEPQQLPGFFASVLKNVQQGVPAAQLPDTLDDALRESESETAEASLRKLAASAESLENNNPGVKGLSGVFERLASFWGNVQKNKLPGELIRSVQEKLEQSTCRSEKEHQKLLETTMQPWSPAQRAAFSALLAGRWLQRYEAFSEEEAWGEPDRLRQILSAVWDHLGGRKLSRAKLSAYSREVIENAPDTEEFDAPEALTACELIDRSLECCQKADNRGYAVSAAIAACTCYAMMAQGPGYSGMDAEEDEQLWQSPAVRREIGEQVRLLGEVGAFSRFDEQSAGELRRRGRTITVASMLKRAGAVLLILCSLASFYLAFMNPEDAGGRGGLLVTGLLFLGFAFALWRRRR